MRRFTLFLVWLPLVSFALPGVEILSNNRFQGSAEDEMPSAWKTGGDGEVIWDRADDSSVIGLRATTEKQFTFARQTAELPDQPIAAILLVADVRLEDVKRGENSWHSGRIMLSYLDAEGREIRNAYGLDRLEGDADWQQVSRQFPLEEGATSIRLELQLFYPAQGEISFRNVHLRALNKAEAEAWRVEADARIAKYRMADLDLKVVDQQGQPVSGAGVAVRMRRHAYPFGTAVKTSLLLSDDPEAQIYQGVVTNFFNSATFEGALKDRVIERNGLEPVREALDWLREREMKVRGHVLIWPSWTMTPASYEALAGDPDALQAEIRAYFAKVLSATEGMIYEWDVVNEPLRHNDIIRLLGNEAVAEWFQTARKLAPGIPLMVNENNVVLNAGNRQALIDWVSTMRELGAPIDRVGVQGHMWHRTMPSGQAVLQDLDALASLGLPVVLTEYSANSRFSEAEEARYLDELLHAWFSHPATVGFTAWGFKDDLIWTDNAFLFRKDWSLKPAGLAWLKKVYGEWWTEADGRTDAEGRYVQRGFKGEYEVEVRHAGRKIRKALQIGDGGTLLTVQLDASAEVDDPDQRLGSFNPWTTGKLPAVRSRVGDQGHHTVSVNASEGTGALALVPALDFPVKGHYPLRTLNQPPRDLYLRFDLSGLPADQAVGEATLELTLADTVLRPGRIRIYALSHRFVGEKNELGLDWRPETINLENAPGRSASDGGFDLGDARVLYVGDLIMDETKIADRLRFSSPELRRVVANSSGEGLTLILSAPDAETLSIAGPGRSDTLSGPLLKLEYPNP